MASASARRAASKSPMKRSEITQMDEATMPAARAARSAGSRSRIPAAPRSSMASYPIARAISHFRAMSSPGIRFSCTASFRATAVIP
jgi:hypothetical protein